MDTTTPALSVQGLTKRYRRSLAVDGLTVDLPSGVVAGFVGPNGAGKTTTMAMLLGLVRPTAGTGTVLGEPLERPERYLPRVGALVEGPAFWPALTALENLRVLARLAGHDEEAAPALLDLVGLAERSDDRFGEYSFGMKQRLGIAAALLGDPALLVLDEPTNGLDPQGMSEMRALIRRVGGGDRTVLVSSHLLGELEQTCDWLLVVNRGRLVYAGETGGFAPEATPEVVLEPLEPTDVVRLADVVRGLGLEPARRAGALLVAVDGEDPRRVAASLNEAAAAAGVALVEVHVRRPTLESSYLHLLEGARP